MSAPARVVLRPPARRDLEEVAATGTDPDLLLALVTCAVGHGPGPGALRRRARELPTDAAGVVGAAGGPPVDDPRRALRTLLADPVAPALPLEPPAAGAGVLAAARDVADALARWAALGVRAAVVGDAAYPVRLAAGWPDVAAPLFVAWRGVPPADAGASVAIVGARAASGYGRAIAAWLAEAVAVAGARVVSGGAVGIDAAAHEAALELPGGTTVVLGCGHAVPYPREHAREGGLFGRVLDHGGTVLSELLPTTPPRPAVVRTRNRVLAGLADVVVVVEGGARSGALLTAGAAAELDRTLLAVPGDVRAPGSAAPHLLLAEGAAPCTGPADVLAALGSGPTRGPAPEPAAAPGAADHPAASVLPLEVLAVLEAAWPRPLSPEVLAERSGLAVPRLLGALARARDAGVLVTAEEGLRLGRPPAR
jgi:DNA processing protein